MTLNGVTINTNYAAGTTPAMRQNLTNMQWQQAINAGGGIAQNMGQDLGSGAVHISNAVSSANAGLGSATAGAGAMRGDAASMRGQANLVNTEAGKVGAEADALKALIPQLDPYKDKLGGYGDELSQLAQMYLGESKDAFGQARALAMQDPNATGLAGEYLAQYDLLSPDRYVSRAASDAQSSIDNARAQNERYLARRGVSVGSGASAASSQLQAMKEAAVLAAAKTLGRQMGIDERGKWINQMTSAADTMYNWGLKQGEAARGALGEAGDMQKSAAGIVAQQGDMTKDVAAIRSQVAGLYANAANIFGNAGSLEGNAANLELSAYRNLTAAQEAAAQYYLGTANVASRGGGGGMKVVSAPADDDWFNWKGTGHSETWNKNHNPNYDSLIG